MNLCFEYSVLRPPAGGRDGKNRTEKQQGQASERADGWLGALYEGSPGRADDPWIDTHIIAMQFPRMARDSLINSIESTRRRSDAGDLALEDGRIFRGEGYGAKGECYGEVVFNTSLTGYQEIFTDPSYAGQIVVLTNPQIGNYGTNAADNEATKPYIEGLVTREFSPISSNWRSQQVADEYLERYNVPVISEIDTRALVRHLRTHGVMRGVISSIETDTDKLVAKATRHSQDGRHRSGQAWSRPRAATNGTATIHATTTRIRWRSARTW